MDERFLPFDSPSKEKPKLWKQATYKKKNVVGGSFEK